MPASRLQQTELQENAFQQFLFFQSSSRVYILRGQDQKMSRGVQRDSPHRLLELRNDDSVAGLCAPLSSFDQQCRQGNHAGALPDYEWVRPAALPVPSQGLRGVNQTGKEYERTGDG